ncbi:putative ABC transporter [Leptomonas pyrrhocoris]|uniref:Putative ABC transporter n=1 Tax=Leptomonas pyrrhocoris TaxID=157538 RepID=A0A0M9FW07_LEPPY|nr:putative ABC transporter [Leptomonas pyrrhocoris]XP_015655548.1 putative ABC transporter [Leptomonas pyrrhocoris]KPA77108.1 putative ABC transporter [Leptomonas pyrrhocoris]KPA77109.1 putative ABC transporter [Leptomonas pyrrhocoris]|eukprot:XP_015655547.1 putative ABC transporter [Leptomonas pyrrhocoris]
MGRRTSDEGSRSSSSGSEESYGGRRFATGGNFFDQIFAILYRTFQQTWRTKSIIITEVLLPFMFIVITLILWAVWLPFMGGSRQFISNVPGVNAYATLYKQMTCYNKSLGPPIPGLCDCNMIVRFVNIECSGDHSSLPYKSLCYVKIDFDFSKYSMAGYSIGNITGANVPVQLWINAYNASLWVVPTLDEVIVFHWLARLGMSQKQSTTGSLLAAGISAGLLPNSKQSSINCFGDLYFVGTPAAVNPLLDFIRNNSLLFNDVYGGTFATAAEAEARVRAMAWNWAIIELNAFDADNFDVNIRMNSTALPTFQLPYDKSYGGGYYDSRADLYATAGYLSLQQLITEHYLTNVADGGNVVTDLPVDHFMGSAGYVPYITQPLLSTAGILLPLIFVMAYLYPVSQFTKRIVLEKELRIREAMHIMGLGNAPIYISWYITFFLPNFITSVISLIVIRLTYITITNVLILFLIYFLYIATCVPLAGFYSAFFNKARLASLLTPLIYFVFAMPAFAIQSANTAIVTVFCIFPPTAYAVAMLGIINHEIAGGFSKQDWQYPLDTPPVYLAVIMMSVDFVFFNLLMLYLDNVMPKEWGTPKHPLFFILDPIDWCFQRKHKRLEGGPDGRAENGVFETTDYADDVVSFDGLRKVYSRAGKKFVAVNNLYWGMQEGEISVLLGHNGAGKTTVLNMMTGMAEPDEGDCYIYGHSVRTELDKVRQQIGYCPQHNILWSELTCREHLEFYGRIKGLKGWELEDAVCRMLFETDLLEKVDQPAKSLSGGQKRKLSVSIAFVTCSRLIFLDEPTAGMDVGARRYTWELLRRMSAHHTILLTTHYMDEADLLGHKIGIMSQGCLKCSGSSMFLKSNLGVGYSITMSLRDDARVRKLTRLVKASVDGALEMGVNGCEAMYRLPNNAVEQFPAFLDRLEAAQEKLGVRGYSLSATTLEEIFLSVSQEDIDRDRKDDPLMQQDPRIIAKQEDLIWNCEIVEGRKAMLWSQFKAMMSKRLWNGMRDRKMQFFQIVCPVICILISMLLSLISMDGPETITLNHALYPDSVAVDMNGCNELLGVNASFDDFAVRHYNFQTGRNLSMYMVDSFLVQPMTRVEGVVCNDPEWSKVMWLRNNVMHIINSSTYHQGPISMNAVYQSLLEKHTNRRRQFTLRAGTMPRTVNERVSQDAIKTILMGAIIMIPFTFLPSNVVAWVVKERECKARHLQNVSGLSFYVYWLTNFLFDIAAYVLTMCLVLVIFACFNRSEYIANDRIGAIFVLFFIYGLSSTTTGYMCSFFFEEHSNAQTIVMAVSFVVGFLLVMIVYIMSLLSQTQQVAEILKWITRIVPSFAIGEGIINMAMLTQKRLVDDKLTPWSMETTGWADFYMAIEFPLFFAITLFIDHPRRRMWGQKHSYDADAEPQEVSDEDSDVEEVRQSVYEQEEKGVNDDMVRVVDLRKVYANGKEAVRNLTFSVRPGEVFGFLGTNGAGKTTTISILCQEFIATSGVAYICGYNLLENSAEALQCIGYCPQFDATLDLLTVEEHMYLYSGVRGISYAERDGVVDALLRMCELSVYRKTLSAQLSGGNRRKLSVALSLIGGPSVVFLDEPSAGMDPVARRGLWNAIEKVADNSSVVLTTHHLEEVEALAHRVAIMVDGTLRCIGDKTHLKNKFGTGFEMSIRVETEDDMEELHVWVKQHFPAATLNEYKGRRFVYTLPADVTLSDVFRLLQANKTLLHIIDYSVSQTSIEQVFLRISGELEEATAFRNTLEDALSLNSKKTSNSDDAAFNDQTSWASSSSESP